MSMYDSFTDVRRVHCGKCMMVLFVCRVNVNRSQIAVAIFNKLSRKNTATSAGMSPKVKGRRPLKDAHHNPIAPMKEYGYDISHQTRKRFNRKIAEQADKVVLIFSKEKYRGRLPLYFKNLTDVEWWDVKSISDEVPLEEYHRLERKRIKRIESLVKDLVKRIG